MCVERVIFFEVMVDILLYLKLPQKLNQTITVVSLFYR